MQDRILDFEHGKSVFSGHRVKPSAARVLGELGVAIDSGDARLALYFTRDQLLELAAWLVYVAGEPEQLVLEG